MYEEIRIAIEFTSAVICFILLRFMIKPYENTGESKYLGLPIGFGFLGITYVVSALAYYLQSLMSIMNLTKIFYFQLVLRTFAFFFMAATYYFSKKPTEKSRSLWRVIFAILIIVFVISTLLAIIPNVTISTYQYTRNVVRVFNIIIILYICIHTFRSHEANPDHPTIWIPIAYTFLAVSQYSVLLFQLRTSLEDFSALFGALVLRLVFLSIFLIISFRAFYRTEKDEQN